MELNIAGEKPPRNVCDNTTTPSTSLQCPDEFGRTQSQPEGTAGTAAPTNQSEHRDAAQPVKQMGKRHRAPRGTFKANH